MWKGFEYLQRSSGIEGGDENGTLCLAVNWDTLFLDYIETGA
jgi:hypothetical protein